MNYPDRLEELITASLMSEGEIYNFNDKEGTIVAPFTTDRSYYLSNYIQHYDLYQYVQVKPRKGQLAILVPDVLFKRVKEEWYEKDDKIVSRMASSRLSLNSIATCINLYGSRRLESITIPSSVHKRHLKKLSYYIEKELRVFTIAENKEIKLPDVMTLFLNSFTKLSSLDSTHLANFLTNKEKNELIKHLANMERECFV